MRVAVRDGLALVLGSGTFLAGLVLFVWNERDACRKASAFGEAERAVVSLSAATIDPAKVGLPVSVFVAVETADHSGDWLKRFADVVAARQSDQRAAAWLDSPEGRPYP